MTTSLPASAVGFAPSDTGSSPLGACLGGLLRANLRGLAVDMVEPAMLGVLATATLPFDPKETIQPFPGQDQAWTLLEATLKLASPHLTRPRREWPTHIEAFGPHLRTTPKPFINAVDVDNEWVAAALVAGGCNPWEDGREDSQRLPWAVDLAIQLGYSGLVDRFLDCPGAWDAQQVFDASMFPNQNEVNVGHYIVSAHTSDVLGVLTRRGAGPTNPAQWTELLTHASAQAVETLEALAPPVLPPEDIKSIARSWAGRQGMEALDAREIARMSTLVLGSGDETNTYRKVRVNELLGSKWGEKPNGSKAMAYDFMPGHDPQDLVARVVKKGGPSSGQWSVLAAAAFSRIRQAQTEGAWGWSTSVMLARSQASQAQPGMETDAPHLTPRACLKDAMGFDWRPGIAIDGVMALALLGQRGEINLAGEGRPTNELQQDLQDFAQATGVDDVMGWAQQHAQAAADFSLSVLKNPSVTQSQAMTTTWATALRRNPGMARHIQPSTAAKLLMALTANFQSLTAFPVQASYLIALDQVADKLFPGMNEKTFKTEEGLEGPRLTAAIIMALKEKVVPVMKLLETRKDSIPLDDFPLIEQRISVMPPTEARIARATLEEWRLERTLPQARVNRGPGGRF